MLSESKIERWAAELGLNLPNLWFLVELFLCVNFSSFTHLVFLEVMVKGPHLRSRQSLSMISKAEPKKNAGSKLLSESTGKRLSCNV